MSISSDKRSLGKGLTALLAEASSSFQDSVASDNSVRTVDLKNISFNEGQPRKIIKDSELSALSESIKAHGVIQPIILRTISQNNYQIIAGERRYHASKMAGLSRIPAIIRNLNEIDAFEIAVIENIQRENLTAVEEAQAYRKLIDEYGHTQESLSHKMGKSRSYISNTMRLLKLPDEVIAMLMNNQISVAHARAIINANDPVMIANMIVQKSLSVRETEKLVQSSLEAQSISSGTQKKESIDDPDMLKTERMLSRSLGADVRIKQGKNDYCNITIKCRGMHLLDEIIAKLEGSAFDI